MGKKTHNEYVAELAVKNPNVEIVEKYINSKTKILHRCLIHNIEWKTSPNVALQGCGCKECHNEKLRNTHQKTHEEYAIELAIKNSNIEVIEKYAGVNTKIMHHCLIHDIEWKTSPASALQGSGCPKCKKEKLHEIKTKTHEQYVNELAIKNPNIEIIGKYIDIDTPIEHYCKIHNIFWNARPENLLFGQCCPLCGREKQIKSRRKTHEQYVDEVKTINSNIEVVGEYINNATPIVHRCKIDSYEWNATPSGILSGSGCPKCANNIKKTHNQYIHELETLNPDIDVIDTYVNFSTPILHKCKIHDIKWKISPAGALNGHGCPKCWRERNGQSRTKSHQEYVEKLKIVNPNIEVIDEYKKLNIPIKHRCLFDGYEWFTTPQSTLQGSGCPKCYNISHGE
ncbi:MAG: hypothetical protein NC453_29820, partial [Muribaculum sp.]|nr:hypothetical protein [Muribaculum sp.]